MPTNHYHKVPDPPGILALLQALAPPLSASFDDALALAERQADHLLKLLNVRHFPIPEHLIGELPRIAVRYRRLAVSGMSYWNNETWIICLNEREPRTRQRFTLLHELKHIIDHHQKHELYRGTTRRSPSQQAERAADYFAGCVLVPEQQLRRAWVLERDTAKLAQLFDVSYRAMAVRLTQVGLSARQPRPALHRLYAALCRSGWFRRPNPEMCHD